MHLNKKRAHALVWHVTVGASPWWLGIGIPLFGYLALGLFWCGTEQQWRYDGLMLQLGGIYLVASGLVKTRERFEEPTPFQALRKWFATLRTLLWAPQPIDASLNVSLSAMLSATGTVRATLSSTPLTIEQRIAALESSHRDLEACVGALAADNAAKHDALKSLVADERVERTRAYALLHGLIKAQVASDMHISITGILWVIAGTIASTVSIELSAHLSWWQCW